MRRQLLSIPIVLALSLTGHDSSAQSPNLRSVMREKLASTQQLLEGVVTANFAMVDKSADRLGQISYTEVASWQSNAEPDYLKQASAFVKAVQGLRKASADRNSRAVADEYVNLVNSCVSCHSYVRRMKPIRLGD
jgi:cytochrome c556